LPMMEYFGYYMREPKELVAWSIPSQKFQTVACQANAIAFPIDFACRSKIRRLGPCIVAIQVVGHAWDLVRIMNK
jgi:hypothetical protein